MNERQVRGWACKDPRLMLCIFRPRERHTVNMSFSSAEQQNSPVSYILNMKIVKNGIWSMMTVGTCPGPVAASFQRCYENATFGRGLTPPMNLMNKPLNVMFLHCPHLQLHPFIPSYGKWLPRTIDIFPGTEKGRAHPPPPASAPAPAPRLPWLKWITSPKHIQ